MPSLERVTALNERVGARLRNEIVDRHALLELATILVFVERDIEELLECESDDVCGHTSDTAFPEATLAQIKNALQSVRADGQTASLRTVRESVTLAHTGAAALLSCLHSRSDG